MHDNTKLTKAQIQEIVGLIGVPWKANSYGPDAYDCYGLTTRVQRMYGVEMPRLQVENLDALTKGVLSTEHERQVALLHIARTAFEHPERRNWLERPKGSQAQDGDIVMMCRAQFPTHIGTFIGVDGGNVLHADADCGQVVFEDLHRLAARGWAVLKFYYHNKLTAEGFGS